MDRNELQRIIEVLEAFQDKLLLAERCRDKRRREKAVKEARSALDDYVLALPVEVRTFLDDNYEVNALAYQHARKDIGPCINALKGWLVLL